MGIRKELEEWEDRTEVVEMRMVTVNHRHIKL